MNEQKAKKIRQLYRREVREKILRQMNFLRPKPKLVPTFIWKILYKIVFKSNKNKL